MTESLIANARMYSVAPGAAAAWKRLFAWLVEASGVPLTVIDHAFPARLSELWERPDLACTFMCGWPHVRLYGRYPVLAAPIPSADFAAGRPVYCSHFAVRRDAPFRALADTFGHRFGYTIEDSHSGYNVPRHHLLRYRGAGRGKLYREIVGPLTTPRRMLEAIAEGRVDVGPLDSFAFALLQRHEPALAAEVRVVESSALAQMPAFVASPAAAPKTVEALAAALCTVGERPELGALRDDLCVRGFARVSPEPWALTEAWAKAAAAAGYAVLE
jgi:ABC-type phosphate/phosphonate transport system substrate-binding protein